MRAAFPSVAAPLRILHVIAICVAHPMVLPPVVAETDAVGFIPHAEYDQVGPRGAFSIFCPSDAMPRNMVYSSPIVASETVAEALAMRGSCSQVDVMNEDVPVAQTRLLEPSEVATDARVHRQQVPLDADVGAPGGGRGSGSRRHLLVQHGEASAGNVTRSSPRRVGMLIGFRSPLSTPTTTAAIPFHSLVPTANDHGNIESDTCAHYNCRYVEGAGQ